MLKSVVNFVKGDMPQETETKQEIKNETTEEKMVKNLQNKIQSATSEPTTNTKNQTTNIYESDVFTNRSNQVKIVKPKSFDNAEVIGEAIKDGKVIILDLNKLETPLATRILDFISGLCFAYNIEPEKVESKIFMIDPQHKRKR